MSRAAVILAWALALLTPTISSAQPAQMYPRAEQGAVMLIVGAPTGLDVPVTVNPGQVAWTQSARPANGARLVDPLPKRIRPSGKPLPAGELLFGYRLAGGGMAYCPPLPYQGLRSAQCVRDIDNDGAFDACYIGDTRGIRSRFMPALVEELSGCGGRYRYAPAEWSMGEAVPAALSFNGYRDGAPVFLLKLEDQALGDRPCKPEGDGVCAILGLRLRIEPVGEAVRITKLSAEEVKFEAYLGGGLGMRRLIYPKGNKR